MSASSSASFSAPARDPEIELLVDLMRLSRLTVLYGEAGFGKESPLRARVMSLLDALQARGQREVVAHFDSWDGPPLSALHARLEQALADMGEPAAPTHAREFPSLVERLSAWQQALDLRFLIVLDRFEEYLVAPLDAAGIREFDAEFVRLVNEPSLRANVLIALDQDAEPLLLDRFRDRIPRLADNCVRLARSRDLFEAGAAREDVAARESRAGAAAPAVEAADALTEQGRDADRAPAASTVDAESAAARAAPATEHPPDPTATRDDAPAEEEDASSEIPASSQQREDREEGRVVAEATLRDGARGRKPLRTAALALVALAAFLVSLSYFLVPELWQSADRREDATRAAAPSAPPAEQTASAREAAPEQAGAWIDWDEMPRASEEDYAASYYHGPPDDPLARPVPNPARAARLAAPAASDKPRQASAPSREEGEVAAKRNAPLLYIHVRTEAQREWAERMIGPLTRKGIRVSGIKVVDFGPSALDLRYFRPEERDGALEVARVLEDAGLPAPQLKRIGGFEDQAIPRQYELWLAPPG